MEIGEKLQIIHSFADEVINEDELTALLQEKEHPVAYDGFEPSGNIHIAQGLMRAITVNKLTSVGFKFKFWVADWFGWINNKMGGDLDKIKVVGDYYIEVWKACGMDMDNIEFIWASKSMNEEYWKKVMQIGMKNTVTRIARCGQIMGRSEKDTLSAAQIFYPVMQCADIFHLEVDVAQLGMDQRKVNVLAREMAPKLGWKKPIAIHHHMLMGLKEPKTDLEGAEAAIAKKMSKSDPNSAIFMTDTVEQVEKKFKKAFCPEGQVDDNPILEYFKYIIFEKFDKVSVERPEDFGGNVDFDSYSSLEEAFEKKSVHPADLKNTAAKYINEALDPIRKHFETNDHAKALLEKVQSYEVTK